MVDAEPSEVLHATNDHTLKPQPVTRAFHAVRQSLPPEILGC